MASVLFSTVGQAIGGPLGAGIGAALGANVDRSLFRSARRGAEDGFASRSAYGEIVPQVFGRARVAGQLIWATAPASSGSKGQGRRAKATSFAMALSRGPVVDIGRIWADGNLLRTPDGTFLTDCQMRIHSQGAAVPDPLLVAAEGEGDAPSYAHFSYAVFEGFDLGPYGNRIPSLSFEVLAGGGTSADWLASLGASLGVALEPVSDVEPVDGYTARIEPVSADLADLLSASGCILGVRDGRQTIIRQPRMRDVGPGDFALDRRDPDTDGAVKQDRKPSGLSLSFQDRDRDFQIGWQREDRNARGPEVALSWPLAATASTARAIAVRILQEAEAGSETIEMTLPHRFLTLAVGDAVRLSDGASWLVVRREVRGLTVWIEGRRLRQPHSSVPLATDAGRILEAPSQLVPPSVVRTIEPPVPLRATSGAALLAAASGSEAWEGAEVRLLQGGDELPVGSVADHSPFGVLAAELGVGPGSVWDERSRLLVDISAGYGPFMTRTARDVLDGAGLVLVGEELIQYQRVTVVTPGIVSLSGLLRGRFGTTIKAAAQGQLLLSIPRTGGAWLDVDADMVGRDLDILVVGPGDPAGGTLARHVVDGCGLAPLAPVHLRGQRQGDGAVTCSWVERRRSDWSFAADGGGSAAATSISYLWHFQPVAGPELTLPAGSSGIQVAAGVLQSAYGGGLPSGSFRVEAIGTGPASIRCSPWVAI